MLSGTVRNQLRYVLVSYEGVVNDDYVIFVSDSSAVTIYTRDGSTFDGDLLALESFAALNASYAVAVEPPPDFDGKVKEESFPGDEDITLEEKVMDWSEDQPSDTESGLGVNLGHIVADKEPVKELDGETVVGEVTLSPTVSHADAGIPPAPDEDPPHLGVTPDGVVQGLGLYDKLVSFDRRQKINLPGTVIPLDMISQIMPENYGTAFRKKGIPKKPMVVTRDLGNCIMGMPTWVGTTIVGPLRPDTGGKDPSIADHDMWLQYDPPVT
jgi:hypothetical protein